jgi:4-cresol dehydrogenase (hydroxylating)
MNRILEVHSELAYAVIEPGVTQGQLAEHLSRDGIPLMLDGNGAGPEASFIGNIVDRGFGHSRYGDRFSHCCNMEAVLADGSVFSTGFGSYPHAQAQHVYKHGVGPSLDGLLSQSNIAVVTKLTLWLQPRPEAMTVFFVTLTDPASIGPLVERLRSLMQHGVLRTTMHIFNDRRLLASELRFPYDQADGRQALEVGHPALLRSLLDQYRIPAWAASGSISGSREMVAAVRRTVKRQLQDLPGLDRLVFLDERKVQILRWAQNALNRFPTFEATAKFLGKVRLGVDLLKGIPSYESLKGGHWRARATPGHTLDPIDSGSGLIWVSPVIPMTAHAIENALGLAEPVFHEFGFEFQVTVSCLNERSLCAVTSICFDHQSKDETARAQACERTLVERLVANGLIPYRASPPQQAIIRAAAPEGWAAARRLRSALDPTGTIAPGRYSEDTLPFRAS